MLLSIAWTQSQPVVNEVLAHLLLILDPTDTPIKKDLYIPMLRNWNPISVWEIGPSPSKETNASMQITKLLCSP